MCSFMSNILSIDLTQIIRIIEKYVCTSKLIAVFTGQWIEFGPSS